MMHVEPGTEYTWTLRDEVVKLDEKSVGIYFAFTTVHDGGNGLERSGNSSSRSGALRSRREAYTTTFGI